MLSGEDKKDVARVMGKSMASKVSKVTSDAKSKALKKVSKAQYDYKTSSSESSFGRALGKDLARIDKSGALAKTIKRINSGYYNSNK